jgi:fatty acid desaturase
VIKQRNTTPDNQNQNHAERKIQEVKKLTIHALTKSQAPLVFWCYAMKYVIDCLHHRATKGLEWRTPMEITAEYIKTNKSTIQRSKWRTEPIITWAHKTLRDVRWAVKRLLLENDFTFDDNNEIRAVRRACKKQ